MNPTPSESITADAFMEFEDDASAFANGEPECVSIQPAPLCATTTPALEQMKTQLALFTVQERAELAHFLIQSLGEKGESVEAAWEAEAARRLEEIKAGQVVGKPAAQMFDELRAKHS
jgi:putative addiction module component (TIGR02574 family)